MRGGCEACALSTLTGRGHFWTPMTIRIEEERRQPGFSLKLRRLTIQCPNCEYLVVEAVANCGGQEGFAPSVRRCVPPTGVPYTHLQ